MQPTGYILYRGPSMLDGSPIVVVATGFARRSANAKTGDMVQTYILADGINPVEASRSGADAAVCGDCKMRPINGGACYVTLIHGPSAVYRALQAGSYPVAGRWTTAHPTITDLGAGRMVRLGTYGDPAAVPAWVWQALVSRAAGRTGYTHQWSNGDLTQAHLDALRSLMMASADSPEERTYAAQLGWRTFRVMVPGEQPGPREFTCPASEEAGKRTTCAECRACDGAQRGTNKASPVILAHGSKARKFIALRSIPA